MRLNQSEVQKILLQSPHIGADVQVEAIQGPFDGKINTILQITTNRYGDMLLRCRTSRAFRYEPFTKEKILYPLLDGALDPFSETCAFNVRKLLEQQTGSYTFQSEPAVHVQDLLYWDETLEILPYPYTIKRMIPGRTLYEYMGARAQPSDLNPLFEQAGQVLGKLHQVKFPGFYDTIDQIGLPLELTWESLYWHQCSKELAEAKKHKPIQDILPRIAKILRDGRDVVRNEGPVLFHNDFQAQNIIIDENKHKQLVCAGVIDFDNWRIGPATQDFVKMHHWTIRGHLPFEESFLKGYLLQNSLPQNFPQLLQVYTLLWFVLVFNFEMDKAKKREQKAEVDQRFPAAREYLVAMKSLLEEMR